MFRLACLISGSGSTTEAIIISTQTGRLRGKINPVVVISSNPTALGLAKAAARGVATFSLDPRADHFDILLLDTLKGYAVDLVGQYGWMPKTPPEVIAAYRHQMINQHNGPLDPGWLDVGGHRLDFGGPGMYGKRVHAAVLYFARTCGRAFPHTEATAQRVSDDFDGGAVLRRRSVPILASDSVEDLAQRVLPDEYTVQIDTLLDFASGTVAEQTREPLVKRDEDIKLWQAKQVARILYPRG